MHAFEWWHMMTHPPRHDSCEPWPDRRCASSSEELSCTAQAGFGAAIHTIATDRPQEVACHIIIDSPGIGVQVMLCGHHHWRDRGVVPHISTPLQTHRLDCLNTML